MANVENKIIKEIDGVRLTESQTALFDVYSDLIWSVKKVGTIEPGKTFESQIQAELAFEEMVKSAN